VQGLPAALTVVGIYAVQVLLSYVVPSGSGQAALALPILAPLGDLVETAEDCLVETHADDRHRFITKAGPIVKDY